MLAWASSLPGDQNFMPRTVCLWMTCQWQEGKKLTRFKYITRYRVVLLTVTQKYLLWSQMWHHLASLCGTGNSSSTLPPPRFRLLLAPLNSWMVTMWAATQMCGLSWPLKIAIMIFADFCPVLVFGTPGWLFAFLNVSRLWADEF